MAERKNPLIILLLVIAGESIFFLPFVLPRIFRPTLLSSFDITNLELGSAFSVYGIVALASYFLGGPLADRFPARNLISSALCLTALGGLAFLVKPTLTVLMILYGYWGFTTIFLLWAAMIKATRDWGGTGFQGRAFGILEGGRGLTSAIIGLVSLIFFSSLVIEVQVEAGMLPIQKVILGASGFIFLVGLFIWWVMPVKLGAEEENPHLVSPSQVFKIIQDPVIWMQGLLIVCAYVGYKMTDDFSLYANEVLGFDEVDSAAVGTVALWLRPVFALAAGIAADRFKVLHVIAACFLVMIIGGGFVATGLLDSWAIGVLAMMVFSVIGIYGLRGIYFAVMDETKISAATTGTAVGIMSLLGYTPDIFISPIMGHLLDTNPGPTGHHYVFLTLVGFAVLGLAVSLALNRRVNRL